VRYWQTSYDWRKSEAQLNSFAQFTQTIQGINMHYVHEPADSKDAIPLLLLHGWPGSYFEFYKLIPLLKATGRFHIVVPSLPGGHGGGGVMGGGGGGGEANYSSLSGKTCCWR
jgi:microsomal epoxide hydrolase